ncbi:ER lumen protein retaining receptor [Chondrus crispus]|uniref:ER lumen protein-retaining receptor n=1 Tax=Chondrus crispus TaxID=2769 RepID=R7QPT3_CHOCR|nr:ER lumen protein retaining receptor [Chondrus crispus]CDF40477.1 ER lumen protein retaining receptor [Chondrus crispus]|eukprot:XP_005710771.1 ER lumen protein retaining receptor [Chondrus crispus]
MNIFRLGGDMLHVVSIFLLLLKIQTSHSCAGLSLKTQILYMVVFSTRYLDLFFTKPWHSALTFYNTIMKILFLSSSAYTIYLMQKRYKHTYDKVHDTFRIQYLIAAAAVLALIFHLRLTVFEILWAFSVFLESVAILPQLFLLQETGEVENITSHYIFCLGGYRTLYIFNWVWRYFTEHRRNQWLAWGCGTVQTLIYADFFYYYILSRKQGKKLRLPP